MSDDGCEHCGARNDASNHGCEKNLRLELVDKLLDHMRASCDWRHKVELGLKLSCTQASF